MSFVQLHTAGLLRPQEHFRRLPPRPGSPVAQDLADPLRLGLQLGTPRRYQGLDGYKEMLAGDVDAVAVMSPPYWHPDQIDAAVDAGKHVYTQ